MNAIEAEGLTKRFRPVGSFRDLLQYRWRVPSHRAVEGISIEVRQGEVFGVLGENGAGKSTLIRMLTTTLLPTSGSARVAGYDVVRQPQAVRRVIGLVTGDERSFFWRLTGRQNLRYFAALFHVPRSVARTRIDTLLDVLRIGSYADERFATLSTGTKQRFAIARGMLTDPDVLFLDEPTRALDPIAAEEVRAHVTQHIVREQGRTVVLATHTLEEAEAACDRVAILRAGELVELGTVVELGAKHALDEVVIAEFAEGAEAAVAILRVTPGIRSVHNVDGPMQTIELRLAERTAMTAALRAIAQSGAVVASVTTRRATLADIYRATYASD